MIAILWKWALPTDLYPSAPPISGVSQLLVYRACVKAQTDGQCRIAGGYYSISHYVQNHLRYLTKVYQMYDDNLLISVTNISDLLQPIVQY